MEIIFRIIDKAVEKFDAPIDVEATRAALEVAFHVHQG